MSSRVRFIGEDGLPCTEDDFRAHSSIGLDSYGPYHLVLTTGAIELEVVDFENEPGRRLALDSGDCTDGDCALRSEGKPISCSQLIEGDTEGLVIAGGMIAFDDQVVADRVSTFRLVSDGLP